MPSSKKIYMYPMKDHDTLKKRNPYLYNLSQSLFEQFEIVNYGRKIRGGIIDSFLYFFKADLFYYNWVENSTKKQFLLLKLFRKLTNAFGKKIVWTHHNAEPHHANSTVGKEIIQFLRDKADYIVIHTRESLNMLNLQASDPRVLYFFHPVFSTDISVPATPTEKRFDILIWGNMRRSKGVHDFLQFVNANSLSTKYSIKIIGKFESDSYFSEVNDLFAGSKIELENRFIDEETLTALHHQSRLVFFPYTGSSVLNSGALITSLPKGTSIVGPEVGAFKELGELGLICNYKRFEEVMALIDSRAEAVPAQSTLKEFCEKHTWPNFATFMKRALA